MAILPPSDSERHSTAPPTPFVGRDRELRRCRAVIERVLDSRGQVVLVTGEAGIGKTTLIKALIEQSSMQAALVLTGHCYDLTTTPPYGPWLEILRAMRRHAPLPLPDLLARDDGLASAPNQSVLFDAFATSFRDVAAHDPLVLILEDMHWADQASLDLLRSLTRQIDDSRMLVIVSYRDDEITRRHPLFQLLPILVRESPVERLQLRRLDAEQVRELVASRYDLSGHAADQLTRYLAELSGGNPFFIHELLTALEDERSLRIEADGVTIQNLGKVRMPPLLKQVIERRLSRLDATTREALEVAAVIGLDVPLDVWQAVSQLPEDQLDKVVQEALEHHTLEESPDGTGCRFTHALVRETVHEGIALIRRRRWHQRAAETLAALPAADPDRVAYHFQQAGDARAADWLVRAGERAQRAHAWFSAADRFEAAVGLLEPIPERDRERGWLLYRISQLRRYLYQHQSIAYLDEALEIAAACGDEELHAVALLGRGLLKCFHGDLTSGLTEIEAGSNATERLGDVAAADVRPGGALDRSIYGMWLAFAGRFHDAIVAAQAMLLQTPNPPHPASYRALDLAYSFLGQVDLAEQTFERVYAMSTTSSANPPNSYLALMEHLIWFVLPYQADNLVLRERLMAECAELSDRGKGAYPMLASQYILRMPILLLRGDWDQARDGVADPDVWLTAPSGQQLHRMWAAVLAHHQGDADGVWGRMHALMPAGPPLDPDSMTTAIIPPLLQLVSQTAFEPGDLAIARVWLEAFDRWLEWSGSVLGRAENAVLWAHYHQAMGDLAQAREWAARALTFASDPRQPLALIAVHRTLGQLDILDGRYSEAQQHLRASLTLADACAAPFERALALLALAELQVARNSPDDARVLLGEVVTICEPLAARPTLSRAEALLRELDSTRRPVEARGGLSAREVEVLRLVARGMIDREIAAALFISPRTVTTHVTHILDKLGVNTRTEAAAHAVREGII